MALTIQQPGKADLDNRIWSLARDLQLGELRAGALSTAWQDLGTEGQTALGYSADDQAAVTAMLAMLANIEAVFSAMSADGVRVNRAVLQALATFTQNN